MDSSEKWVLSGIAIKSFLGVGPEGMELNFNSPVVVLSGRNGSGKSTVVSAVEWALFGELEIQITPSKTRDHGKPVPPPDYKIAGVGRRSSTWKLLVHKGEPGAEVSLTFKKGDSTLAWTRRRDSKNPSPADDYVECLEDGQPGCPDAEMVFNITHDLYVRGVAPRQTAIRNLVHYEKAERNEALDSLFGIEKYNKLSVGFSKGVRDLKSRINKLGERFDELQEQLDEQVESADRKLAQRKREGESSGGPPTLKSLLDSLNTISESLDEQPPSDSLSLQELKVFLEDLREKAENIWTSQGPQAKLNILGKIDSAAGPAQLNWRELVKLEQVAQKTRDEIVNEFGDAEALNKLLAEAEGNVKTAEELLASTDRRAGVLDKAQVWIEGHSHSPGFDCPLCRREVERDELASAIEVSLQGLRESGGEVDNLQKRANEAREEEEAAQRNVGRYQKAVRETEIASRAAFEAQTALVGRLVELNSEWKAQQQSAEEEESVTRLLQEVSEMPLEANSAELLDSLLERLGEAVSAALESSREQMNKVDVGAGVVRERIVAAEQLVELLLELEAKDHLLKAVRTSGVEDSIDAVRNAWAIVKCLADVVGSISESKAEEITESLAEPMQHWFRRISCHPLLQSAQIKVKVTKGGGIRRNQYTIRAADVSGKNPVAAGPNLSGGCEMVLAVAALCAIQEQVAGNHRLGLFILDEPIESLDPEHTERMAKALALHAPGKRTIITTSQPLFAQQIEEVGAEGRAEVFTLADFEEGGGSSLQKTV